MKKYLLVFVLCLIAGCASFDGTGPFGGPTVTVKTFNAPIARVKPAVERLGPSSTRVHAAVHSGAAYDAAATSRFIQQTEKALAAS